MKKIVIVLFLSLISIECYAVTPWAKDCVTFFGGSIPKEERNLENCPNGYSHWDEPAKLEIKPYRDDFIGNSTTETSEHKLDFNACEATIVGIKKTSYYSTPVYAGSASIHQFYTNKYKVRAMCGKGTLTLIKAPLDNNSATTFLE